MTREEAIKIIEVVFKSKEAYKHNDSVTHQALNMAIEALSAEAYFTDGNKIAEWIPVSESLPEYPDEVLTTYIVNGNRRKRYVETATYYDGDEGYWSSPWDEYRVAGTRVTVLAWMPLPDPYREENEE